MGGASWTHAEDILHLSYRQLGVSAAERRWCPAPVLQESILRLCEQLIALKEQVSRTSRNPVRCRQANRIRCMPCCCRPILRSTTALHLQFTPSLFFSDVKIGCKYADPDSIQNFCHQSHIALLSIRHRIGKDSTGRFVRLQEILLDSPHMPELKLNVHPMHKLHRYMPSSTFISIIS